MTNRWRRTTAPRWVRGKKQIVTMPKGKMTLDKLAAMVQQGFTSMEESINGRFGELNKRIDALEARFDGLETEISAMRRQLAVAVYQNEFDALEQRVEALERKFRIRSK